MTFSAGLFRLGGKKGILTVFEFLLGSDADEIWLQRRKLTVFMSLTILTAFIGIAIDLSLIYYKQPPSTIYPISLMSIVLVYRFLALYVRTNNDYKYFKAEQREREKQLLIAAINLYSDKVEVSDKIISQGNLDNKEINRFIASVTSDKLDPSEKTIYKMFKSFIL